MKIWYSYGSEHSMNLVMIGRFKSVADAKKTKQLIDRLTEELVVGDRVDVGSFHEEYSDDVLELLRETDCYILRPSDFECFRSEKKINIEDKKIVIRTNKINASAFFKLMIEKKAKVEIFLAHDPPSADDCLKMTGQFKTTADAKEAKQLIDRLTEELGSKIDVGFFRERYSDDVLELLRAIDCYILRPSELEHFLYDNTTHLKNNKIILRTEETEVSAFLKLMIENGANVKLFSAHHYPDEEKSSH